MKLSTLRKTLYSLITIGLLLIIWSAVAVVKNEPLVFPHLLNILRSFGSLFKVRTLTTIGLTFMRLIIAVIVTFVIALLITFLYVWRPNTLAFFRPIISLMKTTPLAILSIFLFIIFDRNISPYLICGLVILPLAIEGMTAAISNIDPVLKDDLLLNCINPFKTMYYVYIPLIKEYLVMVFLQVFGLGLKVLVMGEFICQTKNSIGAELFASKSSFEMANLLAWGLLLVLIVVLIETIIKIINKRLKQTN